MLLWASADASASPRPLPFGLPVSFLFALTLSLFPTKKSFPSDGHPDGANFAAALVPFERSVPEDSGAALLTKLAPAGKLWPRCREVEDRLVPFVLLSILGVEPPTLPFANAAAVTPVPAGLTTELNNSSVAWGRRTMRQSASLTVNSNT